MAPDRLLLVFAAQLSCFAVLILVGFAKEWVRASKLPFGGIAKRFCAYSAAIVFQELVLVWNHEDA